MSGVNRPSSPATDSFKSKSQELSMPAASTTRRSWSSPHWPRTLGERSAWTSRPVSVCSVCCASCSDTQLLGQRRVRSDPSLLDLLQLSVDAGSDSFSGWIISSIARWRPSRLRFALLEFPERCFRQLEEGIIVLAQGVRRRGERVAKLDSACCMSASLPAAPWRSASSLGAKTRPVLLHVRKRLRPPHLDASRATSSACFVPSALRANPDRRHDY